VLPASSVQRWGITPPSSGRATAGFACRVTPLMSNVRFFIRPHHMSASLKFNEPNMHVTGSRAVLLGGLCAIGFSCYFGSLLAGVWLRLAMWNGASLQNAYAGLMASSGSVGSWLAMLPQVIAGAIGGYIAARGGERPMVHAALSGLVYLSFVGVMFINPSSQALPLWYTLISLVIPLVSALLGGFVYARRT